MKKWSHYQEAIFKNAKESSKHAIVEALAGSGKTTTLLEALNHVDPKLSWLLVAFNKKIAEELKQRAPKSLNGEIQTFHALGLKSISRTFKNVKVDLDKNEMILDRLIDDKDLFKDREYRFLVGKAISLSKATLSSTKEEIDAILDQYEIDPVGYDRDDFISKVMEAMDISKSFTNIIDYDDMIWFPNVLNIKVPTFDRVFVDEVQDLNRAQIEFALKACKKKGKITVFGDHHQCVDVETLVNMQDGSTKRVGDLVEDDMILAFKNGKNAYQKVAKIWPSSEKTGLKVTTKSGKSLLMTRSHQLWAKRTDETHPLSDAGIVNLLDKDVVFIENDGVYQNYVSCVAMREKCNLPDLKLKLNNVDVKYKDFEFAIVSSGKFENNQEATIFAEKLASVNDGRIISILGDTLGPLKLTAQELKVGMKVPIKSDFSFNLDEIVNIEKCDGDFVDIQVDDASNFYGNDILSHNCIYQFRAADANSMKYLKEALNADTLGLSITYRCPIKVVEEAKKYVPQLEAAPNAIEGKVETINYETMKKNAKAGCFIISRTNAPLIGLALGFLKEGRPANIQGRDIGANLMTIIKSSKAKTIEKFRDYIDKWETREKARLISKHKDFSHITDKADCLRALAEHHSSLSDLKASVEKLFVDVDDTDKIVLSTTHRVKGQERDIVYMLVGTFFEQNELGDHLRYVSITRARKELYYVTKDKKKIK